MNKESKVGIAPDYVDNRTEAGAVQQIAARSNHFNPASLRLPQNFSAANVGVKRVLNTVPIRKPGNQEFVRVHEDPAFTLETMVLELKEDRETFIVCPSLWSELSGELVPKALYTTISRQKVVALWPVRLATEDGRSDRWSSSAHDAAKLAKTRWVRVQANMSLGAYDIFAATGNIPEPEWPDVSMDQIIEIAFRDRMVDSLDHPALRRLRGEV
jgi:hypothetical protein